MKVLWFNEKEKEGTASLYKSHLDLNTVAGVPFEYAYRVQVGMNEDGDVVISPLSKEKVLRGDLDEYTLYKVAFKKSYTRISSTPLMKKISEATGKALSTVPCRVRTTWVEKENMLILKTSGKEA